MRRKKGKNQASATPRESGAQGVEGLREAILDQARDQAREVLHEARLEVEAIQQRAEQDAKEIRQQILDRARHETEIDKQRRISAAELEVHRKQLVRREEQIDALFAAANERLAELRHSDGYAEILQKLVVEAAAALGGGELIVRVNREDAGVLTDELLAAAARELDEEPTLKRGEEFLASGAGVLVETADGRLRYDNTFAARLERFRDPLRTAAYDILTGDR